MVAWALSRRRGEDLVGLDTAFETSSEYATLYTLSLSKTNDTFLPKKFRVLGLLTI